MKELNLLQQLCRSDLFQTGISVLMGTGLEYLLSGIAGVHMVS